MLLLRSIPMRMRIAPVIVAMIVYTNSIPTNVNLISVATVLNMDAVFPTYVDGISLPIALNMNAIRTNVDVITFATRVVMIPFIINADGSFDSFPSFS